MENKVLLEAAEAFGQWMLKNQIRNRMDANSGRTIYVFDQKSGYTHLTHNWTTGTACMAMLALYKRTGKAEYLEAAEYAGHYIMGLQILDQRKPRYYGALREITAQSVEFAPRDATTGAWALV